MSLRLIPCPGCERHVRVTESVCPFCDGALPAVAPVERAELAVSSPPRRLGRAATFLFGAAIAGSAATGCSTSAYGAPALDSGMEDTGTAGDADVDAAPDAAPDAATDTGTADSGSADDGALPDG